MQRITRQLAAALVATFIALGLSAGIAGASSEQSGDRRSKDSGVSQSLTQKATTSQKAYSDAKSWQFLPVNFNGSPSLGTVDMLKGGGIPGTSGRSGGYEDRGKPSFGGDDVTQTNDASADSSAKNKATTIQWADQDQDVRTQPNGGHDCSKRCGPPKGGHDCFKQCDGPKDDGYGYDSGGKQNERPCDRCSDNGKGSGVSQDLDQSSETKQKADSDASSHQFVPINANVTSPEPRGPAMVPLGGKDDGCGCSGHDDKGGPRHDAGDVTQTNDASADSSAKNEAATVQVAHQDQNVDSRPQSWDDKGRGCGCSGHEAGSGVSQDLDQEAETKQYADSKAESWQVVPVNVNAPISVLSFGSNNGDVKQTNDASADSSAKNESFTGQFAHQGQDVDAGDQGSGDVQQDASQDSHTYQKAESEATSHQLLPVNVNAPISVLSFGSNNGDVKQTNDASATSHASNGAFTLQGASQHQNVE